MEMVVFLAVFVIAGLLATSGTGITETLPIMYLFEMVLWAVFDYASERNDYVGDYCTFR